MNSLLGATTLDSTLPLACWWTLNTFNLVVVKDKASCLGVHTNLYSSVSHLAIKAQQQIREDCA